MIEKQKKLLEWFKKLDQFAQKENLPLRLIDSIRDLQEQSTAKDLDWYGLHGSVENLLQNIKQKVQTDASREIMVNDEAVAVAEVQEKITEAVMRAHRANVDTISTALYGSNAPIQECYRQMKEITTDKKALNKIADGNYYLRFFQNVKQNYEKNSSRNFNDFVEGISNNCTHMNERIRSICRNIESYKFGFGEEEFYVNSSERKEGWDNQLRHKIESACLNSHVIMDFAKETREKMQPIIKKFKRKQKFCIVLPIVIVLLCIVLVGGLFTANQYMELKNNQINAEMVQAENSTQSPGTNTVQEIGEIVNGIIEIKDSAEEGKNAAETILILAVLILAVYVLYVIFITKSYHNKITSACGECLQKECIAFEKENRMDFYQELENIVTDYEQHYLEAFNELFHGTVLDSDSVEKDSEYNQLYEEWTKIQRM